MTDQSLAQRLKKFQIREAIHQSNLIEGYDDKNADEQSLAAWQWLVDQEEIGLGVICQLQKRITNWQKDMQPNWRGYFRGMAGNNTNVRVGNHVPPDYRLVEHEMKAWLSDLKQEDSRWMHAMFERIHPFSDGNGRTGRMIMWFDQLQRGEDPWVILDKDKRAYYDWLVVCENQVLGI